MTAAHNTTAQLHASSTGQAFTGAAWLDLHFEVSRPEYEAQVRAVGIQPGWRVLDAACGAGSFLPWLAELVGPTGHLAALDLAPENVVQTGRRVAAWGLPCRVEAREGDVRALPYPAASFDAVWCANAAQYLTDDDLTTALAELRRVVRPGGLVAVKDADRALARVTPAPPGLLLRFGEAAATMGILRTPLLPGYLRRAGLVEVWRRTTLIERAAPLDPPARQYRREHLALHAGHAPNLALPAADQAFWARLRDPAALEAYLDDPDFYGCEGNLLAVGTVPRAAP